MKSLEPPFSRMMPLKLTAKFLLVCVCSLLTLGVEAQSGKRVALLIGNATYSGSMTRLTNPPNDVAALRPALTQLGFQVAVVSNGDQKAMQRAIRTFGGDAKRAEVAFFYYSGHGMQANGENYLIPVGAQIDKESDLAIEAVQLNGLMQQIEEANPQTAIVVLDACRDNPVSSSSRSGSKGLSRIAQTPTNTYIAFAAQPGATATDDGIFARSLAKFMVQPGVSVRGVFDKVAQAVQQHTNNKQRPRRDDGLSTDIVLARSTANAAGTNAAPTVVAGLEPRRTPTDPQQIEDEAWADAKRADTASAYEAYKTGFPKGRYVASANIALARIKNAALTAPSAPIGAARILGPTTNPSTSAMTTTTPTADNAGKTFRDCAACPEMLPIRAGSFLKGSLPTDQYHIFNEAPQHSVSINYRLAVGRFPVTFAEWDACADDGGCGGYRPHDEGWGRGSRPVINVNYSDAIAYTKWLTKKAGKKYRLPSESEWEYAARAGTTTQFYWGNEIGTNNANCDGCGSQWDKKSTSPVGSFPANPFGLFDMAGNVRQLTQDCRNSYDDAPKDGSAMDCAPASNYRMTRGGSWKYYLSCVRTACRMPPPLRSQDGRSTDIGFRVVRLAD
jgi:formylglycine-generating enzyme required for sulfatase activity